MRTRVWNWNPREPYNIWEAINNSLWPCKCPWGTQTPNLVGANHKPNHSANPSRVHKSIIWQTHNLRNKKYSALSCHWIQVKFFFNFKSYNSLKEMKSTNQQAFLESYLLCSFNSFITGYLQIHNEWTVRYHKLYKKQLHMELKHTI